MKKDSQLEKSVKWHFKYALMSGIYCPEFLEKDVLNEGKVRNVVTEYLCKIMEEYSIFGQIAQRALG